MNDKTTKNNDQKPTEAPKPGYKWVQNLMTGKWIQVEDKTPLCCDPSSETYWSM